MDPTMYPSSAEALDFKPTVVTRSLALKPSMKFVQLNNATTAIAATIDRPRAGQFLVITQTDTGTAGHTVTMPSGRSFNTTNAADGVLVATTVATFNKLGETLVLFGISDTRFMVVANLGQVGLA